MTGKAKGGRRSRRGKGVPTGESEVERMILSREEASRIYLEITNVLRFVEYLMDEYDLLAKDADLLNRTSPSFLALVGKLLVSEAIQSLCRVTDSAYFGKLSHLSVCYAAEHSNQPPDMSAVKEAMKPLVHLRHTRMSHTDLKLVLAGAKATVQLGEVREARFRIRTWLDEWARTYDLDTGEPHDQGTWLGAETLIGALKDGENVRGSYGRLLECFSERSEAAAVDEDLVQARSAYESKPFSELAWVRLRTRIRQVGLTDVRRELAARGDEIYLPILLVAREGTDLILNTRDRRRAGRIELEAELLLSRRTSEG